MKPSNVYSKRIKKIQALLHEKKQEACFIDYPIDLFYLTGMHMSLGHLLVTQKGAKLFVDGRYFEAAQKQSIVPPGHWGKEHEVAFLKGIKKLAFDSTTMSYAGHENLKKLKKTLTAIPHLVQQLRLIKDDDEIAKMKKSARFGYRAYQYIRKQCKMGITEIELAKLLEIYCLKEGAERMSFDPIIAFGKNTALPHHHPGKTRLKKNDIILFDLGVVLEDYCSDMTRVDFFGKPDPELQHLYDVNYAAQRAALAKCKPGVKLKELDLAARNVMKKAGLEEYFIHSLGHGVGLEVHETPRIKFDGVDKNVVLQPGMAITIEPGLYLPGKGGVRYEDTVLITEKGALNLYEI